MNAAQAYQNYKDELDVEIMHFRDYDCAFLPTLRLRSTLLLASLRSGVMDIENAEIALMDLRIGREEARGMEEEDFSNNNQNT